jgi:hypothetical protein
MSKEETIKIRQSKLKQTLLDQLKRTPTIELACEKTGVARSSVYRWIKTNKKFAKELDAALIEGRVFISDIAESQIFSLIKDKKFEAIRFWLANNDPRYGNKLEIKGYLNHAVSELTPEQEKFLREALKLALPQNYEPKTQNKSSK